MMIEEFGKFYDLLMASVLYLSSSTRKPVCGVSYQEHQARGLKRWLEVEEELYYPHSENKGADQLYRVAKTKVLISCAVQLLHR